MNSSVIIKQTKAIAFFLGACCMFFQTKAQITVTNNQIANDLAQALVGAGVTVSNPTLSCGAGGSGLFTVTPPSVSNLGLTAGIILTSGIAETTPFSQGANLTAGVPAQPSNTTGNGSDPDCFILTAPQGSFDKCVLEFDFIPLGDSIKFDYVFSSAEYTSFTCSIADVFGFFISGPGITGPFSNNSKNIALVPGTTCPVGVNTINGSTQSPCGNVNPPCSPPNNALFINNQTGTTVAYNGFTQVLTAVSEVTKCQVHHLKLAISDASDQILDSGVWLKQGSLSSASVSLSALSNLQSPEPYMVEGCNTAYVKVARNGTSALSYSLNYTLGGTASNTADYTVNTIPVPSPPGTVTIPAGDSVAYIVFYGIPDGLQEGTEEIIINQLAPCDTAVIGSVSLFIRDSINMYIMTSDTSICAEDSLQIHVFGSDSLTYTWTPITNISNPNIKEPKVSPNVNTAYVVCATVPNVNCPAKCDTIQVNISQPPNVFISNDSIICKDMVIPFNPVISPNQAYTYQWGGSGTGFLSNSLTTLNQVANFPTQGTYQFILDVEPTAVGCSGSDTVTVLVLPNDITLHNGDTAVCYGTTFPINVTGHPLFNYSWTPPAYLNNAAIEDPITTPLSNTDYTVTATFGGCIPMVKSFKIDVQPIPVISAGVDRVMCNWDTVRMNPVVTPTWFTNYIYQWSAATNLNDATVESPVFSGQDNEILTLIVSTPIGCADTDNVIITVHPTEFARIEPVDTTICPRESVNYLAGGAASYLFTPTYIFDDSSSFKPIASPIAPTEITVYSTSVFGCVDTDKVYLNVASDGILDLPNEITMYPGEGVNLPLDGNCSFFNWSPNYHLSGTAIQQPFANPPVTTRYYVTGLTEFGCMANDSITVRISPESIVDLPNAFSPGSGTSVNDELRILKRGTATLNYFKVFNRWGELVFQTNNINQGWNGRYKGEIQPMGSYVYVIDAQTSTGKKIYKQGNVTLIR